jgi:hypothetical protein
MNSNESMGVKRYVYKMMPDIIEVPAVGEISLTANRI